jgi:hypothetical protein
VAADKVDDDGGTAAADGTDDQRRQTGRDGQHQTLEAQRQLQMADRTGAFWQPRRREGGSPLMPYIQAWQYQRCILEGVACTRSDEATMVLKMWAGFFLDKNRTGPIQIQTKLIIINHSQCFKIRAIFFRKENH